MGYLGFECGLQRTLTTLPIPKYDTNGRFSDSNIIIADRVGNGICDSGNNNIGCEYDGGDCCLPQADPRDCIDPCGVRLKFYAGSNRE